VNQVWNWVKGEGSSWERSREPFVYWSACLLEGSEVGATVGGGGLVRGEGKRRGGGSNEPTYEFGRLGGGHSVYLEESEG